MRGRLLSAMLLAAALASPAAAAPPPLAAIISTTASDLVRGQTYTATASIWTDADDRVTATLFTPAGITIERATATYGCLHGSPARQAVLDIPAHSNGLALAFQAEVGCQATIAYLLQVADDAPAGTIDQVQLFAHDERVHRVSAAQSVRVNRTDRFFPVWVPIAQR